MLGPILSFASIQAAINGKTQIIDTFNKARDYNADTNYKIKLWRRVQPFVFKQQIINALNSNDIYELKILFEQLNSVDSVKMILEILVTNKTNHNVDSLFNLFECKK